ncbi:MAG: hypothetical protein HDQ88_08900 [Clostridia bacterium]|nr:hypothetical protein [Clostridia bacterium]
MKTNYQWTTRRPKEDCIISHLDIPNAHVHLKFNPLVRPRTCNVQIAINPIDLANGCELNILEKTITASDLKDAQRESVAMLFDYVNAINMAIKDILIGTIVAKS